MDNIETGSLNDDDSNDIETNESTDNGSSKRSREDNNEASEITAQNKKARVDPKILDGKYFTIKIRNGDNVKAMCSLCGVVRSGSVKATGNFFRHIKEKHSENFQEMSKYLSTRHSILEQGVVQTKLTSMRSLISNEKVGS